MVVSRFTRNGAGQVYTSLTPTFGDVVVRTLSKVALPYNVRYIVTMEYTKERQESDRSFLVGVNYGRESERSKIVKALRARESGCPWGGDGCGHYDCEAAKYIQALP
jgi:hypothetical protein